MLRTLLLVLVALCSNQAFAENVVPLTIGGQQVRFAIDGRYVRASEKAPTLFAVSGAALPPGNRLVEMFVTAPDLKRMLVGQPLAQPHLQVQALRDAEGMQFTNADWTGMRPTLLKQMGAVDADAAAKALQEGMGKRMSATSGTAVSMEFGEVGKPVLHGNDPRSIRFAMVMPLTGTINGVKSTSQIACVGAITVLHGKLVYVYAYKALRDGEKNLQPLQALLDGIVDRAEALND